MTAQGKHRTRPRAELVPFARSDGRAFLTLNVALDGLEAKGYEVRQVRLTVQDHGKKAAVVLHLSPAPGHGLNTGGVALGYRQQNVGKTARRNLGTLLAYVEGLPNVRQADGPVDSSGGGTGVHECPAPGPGEGGA